jgi:hypothetical protein
MSSLVILAIQVRQVGEASPASTPAHSNGREDGQKRDPVETAGSHDGAAPYAAIRFVGFVSAFAC